VIRIPIVVEVDVHIDRVYVDIIDDASGVTLAKKIYLLDSEREVEDV